MNGTGKTTPGAWNYGIAQYILNSVLVTVAAVVLNISISLMAAYALAALPVPPGGMCCCFFILGGLMLAPEVSLIPLLPDPLDHEGL